MAKRIYDSRVKKWAIGSGIVGVPLAVLMIWFMVSLGSIDITGYSGDSICKGTIEDPCYAYINFTAKEDIFIYPGDWGETAFYTDIQPKSVKMFRSWGKGWREIKLNQTCTGTWCGAPNSYGVAYSYAFREGRDYQIRYELLKENPEDTIKWGFDSVDPIFYGFEVTNELNYSDDLKKVKIKDALNNDVAEVTLTSHDDVNEPLYVIRGKNRTVMTLEIENKGNLYKDAIKELEIINMNTGKNESKEFHLEYAIYDWVSKPIYETICVEEIIDDLNKSKIINCIDVLQGYDSSYEIIEWKNFNSKDIPKGNITIGLVIDVNPGDHYDGVFTLFGKKIKKHAEWTESLNNELLGYWKLDGNASDSLGFMNGSITGATSQASGNCKIGTCYAFNGVNQFIDIADNSNRLDNWESWTMGFWLYSNSPSGTERIMGIDYTSDSSIYLQTIDATSHVLRIENSSGLLKSSTSSIPAATWVNILLTYNSTSNDLKIYWNGTLETTGTSDGRMPPNQVLFTLGRLNYAGTYYYGWDGRLDEIFLANRTWTDSEATQWFNNYDGITWTDVFPDTTPPSVIINTPLNQSYDINSIIHNITATDDTGMDTCLVSWDVGITNITMDNVTSTNFNYTNTSMSQGSNTAYFYCNDTLNNWNNTESITFFISSIFPYFITIPTDDSKEYLVDWNGVDFDATDDVGFDSYVVNDKINFQIHSSGFLDWVGQLGVNNYYVNVTINNSVDNLNSTVYNLNITQNNSLTLGLTATTPITYGTTTDFTGSGCPSELSCSLNISNQVYEGGTISANYSTPGNTNYTATSSTFTVTINPAPTSTTLLTTPSSPIEYPATSNFSCSNNESLIYIIYIDDVDKTSEEDIDLIRSTGIYNVSCIATANANYSSSSDETSYTINKNDSLVLGISGTTPITYGTTTDVAGSGCPDELSCSLDKSNIVYGVGTETFNYSTPGNTNYTASSITKGITINKAVPQGNLTSDLGWTINETQEVIIGLSESNAGDGDLTYIVYRDGVSKTTGETWTPALGTYDYVLNTTGGANWTVNSSMDAETLTVNDITIPIPIIVYPTNVSYNFVQSNLNYTYVETNCDRVWISIDSGVTNSSSQACGLNFTGLNSTEGSNNWTLYMNDTSGNENSTTVFFFIDSIPPYFTFIPDDAVLNEEESLDAKFTATDAVAFANFSINWTSIFSITNDGNLTSSTLTAGTFYYINVTINDTSGNKNSTIYQVEQVPYLLNFDEDFEGEVNLNQTLFKNYTGAQEYPNQQPNVSIVNDVTDDFARVLVTATSGAGLAVLRTRANMNNNSNLYQIYFDANASATGTNAEFEDILIDISNGTNIASLNNVKWYNSPIDVDGITLTTLVGYGSRANWRIKINGYTRNASIYRSGILINSEILSDTQDWYLQFLTGIGGQGTVTFSIFNLSMRVLEEKVYLNSPTNNSFAGSPALFNCSYENSISGSNVSLYGTWGSGWHLNQTVNLTGESNSTIFSANIGTGTYLWNCLLTDLNNEAFFNSTNFTARVDVTYPIPTIIYPTNTTYVTNVSELNYTYIEANCDSVWTSIDLGVTNSSIQACGLNFTNIELSQGTNTWTLYINDSANNQNSTSITFFKDVIIYDSSSQITNESGNFSQQDSIFVNVSVDSYINESNITFNLWTSSSQYNQTVFNNSERTINWTNLPENMYFWNVSVCYDANAPESIFNYSGCNTTEERRYGVENINVSIENVYGNVNIELGTQVTINATNNLDTICVDIDYPGYGVNYTCSTWNSTFEFLINYFHKNTLSDGSTSNTYYGFYINNSTYMNDSSINFSSHQYDEIVNLSLNMTGVENPKDIIFYKTNSTEIDRAYYGTLNGSKININKLWDTSTGVILNLTEKNLSYDNYGETLVYMYIDDNAKLENFTLNVTGYQTGFTFTDLFNNNSYVDTVLTNCSIKGGKILPKSISPKNFTYDNFINGVISNNWTYPVDSSGGSGEVYYAYVLSTEETGGFLTNDIAFEEQGGCPNDDLDIEDIRYIYANSSTFDLVTTDEVSVKISFDSHNRGESLNTGESLQTCLENFKMYFGGVQIWSADTSDYCEYDADGACEEYGSAPINLTFNLIKQTNESWMVTINGHERHYSTGDDGVCGDYERIVNWTKGNSSIEYDSCAMVSAIIQNNFYITPTNYALEQPIYFSNYGKASYNQGPECDGCSELTNNLEIYYVNTTLSSYSNCTLVSESVFDSAANISELTINADGRGTAISFVSADDGKTWQNIANLVETPLLTPGAHIKWKMYLSPGTSSGYRLKLDNYLESIIINNSGDYPSNITFDFGNDGINDASIDGYFNTTNGTLNVDLTSADLTTAFTSEDPSVGNHTYLIPLEIHSDTAGLIELSGINLTYDPNPVWLNSSLIQTFLDTYGSGSTNFSISLVADNSTANSAITIDDIIFNYAGGNKTYEVKAHNEDYTINVSRNLTYYYSRWDYNFVPSYVDYLEFIPSSPIAKNITPFGQSFSRPILNLTNYGYGGKNINLSIYLSDTLSCVNLTMSLTQNKTDGYWINESWVELNSNISYLTTTNISMWADYDCSYTTWRLFNPSLYFRQCCDDCFCSEDLS